MHSLAAAYVPSHLSIISSRAAITFAFWSIFAVMAVTSAFWPWWKSFWGWNMFFFSLSIDLALLSPMLSIDFGISRLTGPVGTWIDIVAIVMAGAIDIWRGAIIVRQQMKGADVAPYEVLWAAAKALLRR